MPETTEWASTIWEGDGEIQPEGGLNIEDIEDHGEFDEGTLRVFDEDDTPDAADGARSDGSPTPETTDEADAGGKEDPAPTTEPGPETPKKLKFHAKIDRQESDVEISEEELPGIYQRSKNYERLQQRHDETVEKLRGYDAFAARLGYKDTKDMLEQAERSDRDAKVASLVSDGTAKDIAEDYVDRQIAKARNAQKRKASEAAAAESKAAEHTADGGKSATPSYEDQVADLFRVRPDLRGTLKELPADVTKDVVENGTPLRTAYAEWEARQFKAENDRIRKERELFAQQAETAARAPVRGAQDGGTSRAEKADDAFLRAFRSDRGY